MAWSHCWRIYLCPVCIQCNWQTYVCPLHPDHAQKSLYIDIYANLWGVQLAMAWAATGCCLATSWAAATTLQSPGQSRSGSRCHPNANLYGAWYLWKPTKYLLLGCTWPCPGLRLVAGKKEQILRGFQCQEFWKFLKFRNGILLL